MELFILIITWLGYLFAIIGFTATVYKSIQAWISLKSFSWNEFEKYSKKIIKAMKAEHYRPDVIVTIGRGGLILGGVISGNLHSQEIDDPKGINIPVLGCDRIYKWENGTRIEVPNTMVDFSPLQGKHVLLVAGDILSGGTMKFFYGEVNSQRPASVKSAALVKGVTSAFTPDFYGKEIPGDFKMPWMYKGFGYIRDSRRPNKLKPKHKWNLWS